MKNVRLPVISIPRLLDALPPPAPVWRYLAIGGLPAVFAADALTQLGFAHGVLYVLVILCAMLTRSAGTVLAVSAAAALLTVAGLFISPPAPDGFPWVYVLSNRIVAIVAIVVAAGFSLHMLRILNRLETTHQSLERTAQALDKHHELLRMAGHAGRLGGWFVDLSRRQVEWSDEVALIHGKEPGYSPSVDEGLGFYVPEHRARITALFEACTREGVPFDEELQIRTDDGRRVWVRTIGQAVRDGNGRIVRVQGAFQNIDVRKSAEISLIASLRRFQELAESMSMIVWSATPDGVVDFSTQSLVSYTGVGRARLDAEGWLEILHPDDSQRCIDAWMESVRSGEPYVIEFRMRRHDGAYRWHLTRAVPVRDDDGAITKWYGTATDIHDQKLLEEEARRLAERLRSTLESITDGFLVIDADWRFSFLNTQAERLLGRSREELLGKVVWDAFPEAAGSTFQAQYQRAVEENAAVHFQEYFPPLDRWFDVSAYPGEDGLAVYFRDQTDRRRLEEQLQRSQRLESIGQLTGGIAHDFNNLLTVILGNADLLADTLPDVKHQALAQMIAGAAQRGAELTQRLLAFARRQALVPESMDVNRMISDMDGLLRRALGKHIEIETVRGAGLWPALVDAGQLEGALLNLAINARDAMPDGGRLTIETTNVFLDDAYCAQHQELKSGEYVMLAVSDTGSGISPRHLGRVFEPFFTTKQHGQGTGLGLAMVYGFIKQSSGHVSIYSEPGQGATVKLYLPRAPTASARGVSDNLDTFQARGGAETILLVEDEELVRRYAREQLTSLGYRVMEAVNGPDALETLRAHEDVDLLFTDVVMPGGMSGRALADEARKLRPGLKVLYTSGYTENAIVHHGRLDPGVRLLSKPYRRQTLARHVRAALDEGRSAADESPS